MILLSLILCFILFICAYSLSYWFFRRKLTSQTQKMLQVMRADELNLEKPEDAYDRSDEVFSDLERAAFSLRRKYLRLKKVSRDERKAYETVFSGLKEGVVTVDQNLKVISFNSRFMQLFRWTQVNAQTFGNTYLQDIIRQPEVVDSFKNIFQGPQKVLKTRIDHFELFINLLPSVDENQKWAMGVFYDLSEAQKIDRMRVDFVANASHELRTPVTVIKGYSEVLWQKLKSDHRDEQSLVEPIVQSAENMKLLLDDLLSLSKLESSDRVQKEKLNVRDITESILTEFDAIIAMNKKQILCRYEADFVWAEDSGLRQVMRNLIINAVRYSGAEAPQIFVTWTQNLTSTFLHVRDQGPGIPVEHQDRIFERFYRVDKGRSREQGGTGLGLALVKHQMLNHNGGVRLVSPVENGLGSEFVCEFQKQN